MVEFGGQKHEDKAEEIISDDIDDVEAPERVGLERRNTAAQSKAQAYDKSAAKLAAGTGKLEGRLVQQEKRNTGTIKRDVYKQYFTAGKGWLTIPLILASVLLTQGKLCPTALRTSSSLWNYSNNSWANFDGSLAHVLGEQFFQSTSGLLCKLAPMHSIPYQH